MGLFDIVKKAVGTVALGAIPIVGPMLAIQSLTKSDAPAAPTTPPPPTDSFAQPTTPAVPGGLSGVPNPYAADPFAGMPSGPAPSTAPAEGEEAPAEGEASATVTPPTIPGEVPMVPLAQANPYATDPFAVAPTTTVSGLGVPTTIAG